MLIALAASTPQHHASSFPSVETRGVVDHSPRGGLALTVLQSDSEDCIVDHSYVEIVQIVHVLW